MSTTDDSLNASPETVHSAESTDTVASQCEAHRAETPIETSSPNRILNSLFAPISNAASVLNVLDESVLCGTRDDAWIRPARAFADFMDAIRLGSPTTYAAVVFCVAIGLSWAVISL